MSELRQSHLTGRWVAVAPLRGDRPVRPVYAPPPGPEDGQTARDPGCPFCPGNEDELPAILEEEPTPEDPGWRVRVVPNRYPAFGGGGDGPAPDLEAQEPGVCIPARGVQEVVIETPRHDLGIAGLAGEDLRTVVEVYQRRARIRGAEPWIRWLHVFRNQGRAAGASLPHSHAQLIALPWVPPEERVRRRRLRAFYRDQGRCLLCAPGDAEPDLEDRMVLENEHLRAFVPWAAETAFEVWIVPRRHHPWFGDAAADERDALALALGKLLAGFERRSGGAPHNYMVHAGSPEVGADPAVHWFVQIRPRTQQPAGFELASGMHINASSPEADARALRSTIEGTS